ncbi:MAG: hypothetical protein OEX10_01750 [Candidatus Bathyarchaeota archaeon]|nr:hypothetical protein [Candidatus Bathyarchaeota archaeon]
MCVYAPAKVDAVSDVVTGGDVAKRSIEVADGPIMYYHGHRTWG